MVSQTVNTQEIPTWPPLWFCNFYHPFQHYLKQGIKKNKEAQWKELSLQVGLLHEISQRIKNIGVA